MVKASDIAFRDIHEHLSKEYGMTIPSSHNDFIVTRLHLFTKETKRLNRLLGVHKLNKGKK